MTLRKESLWFPLALTLLKLTTAIAGSCATIRELDSRILNYGFNRLPVNSALTCLDGAKEERRAATVEIDKATDTESPETLREALAQATLRIEFIKAQADKSAHYAETMIDLPGSTHPETSLDCFNTTFQDLQKPTARDAEIVRLREARNSARQLLDKVAGNHDELGRAMGKRDQAHSPSVSNPASGEKPTQAFGNDSGCAEWTDGCVVCSKQPDGSVGCSTAGIACIPGVQRCQHSVR